MFDTLQNTGFRFVFRLLMTVKPPPEPKVFEGDDASLELARFVADQGVKSVLLITTAGMVQRGTVEPLMRALQAAGATVRIFDAVEPNPRVSTVEAAITRFRAYKCDAVLAFGGGSVLDAAKAVALGAANAVPLAKLVGLFKATRPAVPFYAIPTTAGSGSEITSAALLTDDTTHQKLFIIDHKLIPLAVALDPAPMATMPAAITAETGADALTHAIEAYVTPIKPSALMQTAAEALKQIFEHLPEAFNHGENRTARSQMARASYDAGRAFNGMGLGFVHALSHQLTARYGVPHGRTNAVLLPRVLHASRKGMAPALASLAHRFWPREAPTAEAGATTFFIERVCDLLGALELPTTIAEIEEHDLAAIIRAARQEAITSYPVAYLLSVEECRSILLEAKNGPPWRATAN